MDVKEYAGAGEAQREARKSVLRAVDMIDIDAANGYQSIDQRDNQVRPSCQRAPVDERHAADRDPAFCSRRALPAFIHDDIVPERGKLLRDMSNALLHAARAGRRGISLRTNDDD